VSLYSLSDLATRMLKDLGLVYAEEIPHPADLAWAEETVASEVLMLDAIGIPVWNGSAVSVPKEYLTVLSRRCGFAIAPSFGLMDPAKAQLAMREAERYLTIMASPRAGSPLTLVSNDAMPRRRGFDFASGL
jgi:hypothetical protein